MAGSLADTDHVLGHELVHAFQFDITGADPRDGVPAARRASCSIPLWFVEGMAEYLSLGPVDAQTAMWMRDAALHEKLPHIKDLDDPSTSPIAGARRSGRSSARKYGDRAVASLLRSAANPRFDLSAWPGSWGPIPTRSRRTGMTLFASPRAVAATAVGRSQPRCSSAKARRRALQHRATREPGRRHVAFFSERDRFSIELYLADAETGKSSAS